MRCAKAIPLVPIAFPARVMSHRVRLFRRAGDHDWSQRHLSHYVEGDLTAWARRRLERHAAECPECTRGVRAVKALLRLITRIDGSDARQTPPGLFDRVRVDAGAQASSSDPSEEK